MSSIPKSKRVIVKLKIQKKLTSLSNTESKQKCFFCINIAEMKKMTFTLVGWVVNAFAP